MRISTRENVHPWCSNSRRGILLDSKPEHISRRTIPRVTDSLLIPVLGQSRAITFRQRLGLDYECDLGFSLLS